MTSRTLFLAAVLAATATPALVTPVMAQSTVVTTRASSNTAPTLSASDEEFLTQMPMPEFPGKEEMQDRDEDGIVDSEQTGNRISDPFAMPEEEKQKVIYKYNPPSSTSLRRVIKDDRIEDGYVQGYMQQNGPKE